MFTADDLIIGWRPKTYKVLLFATTNIDSVRPKDEGRLAPKGDGTDSCFKNHPPDLTTFENVMKKKIDMTVSLTGEFNDSLNTHERFQSHFLAAFKGDHAKFRVFKCPEFDY